MTSTQQPSELDIIDTILARYPREERAVIQVLQEIHRTYNYLPAKSLVYVAATLSVPLAKVYSVATFYRAFSLTPQGRIQIKVCTGTACHLRGSAQLIEEIERKFSIGPGATTKDLAVSVKTVNCVGACAMAPVLIVGDEYIGRAKPAKLETYLDRNRK